jgi:microcystin-dependent protein
MFLGWAVQLQSAGKDLREEGTEMKRQTLLTAVVSALAASAVAGGVAWASIPGDGGVIQGCYDSGGNVKVVEALPCPRGYTPLQWNQRGEPGPPVTPGQPGTPGMNGTNGVDGEDGVSVTSDSEPAGANCAAGGSRFTAANGIITYACNGIQGPPGTGGGSTPIGAVVPYAGNVAPQGWLVADGSEVSRTTYSALFQAIGTTYGPGDGTSTFNVPDLRGRVVVAVGSNGAVATLGQNEGNAEGSRSPRHTHSVPAHSHGVGTLAVGLAGNHNHSLPGTVDQQVTRCTSSCSANLVTFNTRTLSFDPFSSSGTGFAGTHAHGLTGRVGATSDADGDAVMTSGAAGPSYLALTYIVRTG